MKLAIVALLFLPIIIKALKQDKWYIYLVFAFYAILPDTFAIEISGSLPLITGSRMLILMLFAVWIYKKSSEMNAYIPAGLVVYIGISVALSLIHLDNGIGEINSLFIILFEQLLLTLLLVNLIDNKREFELCIDFMIYGCLAVAVMAVMQTVLSFDVTTSLDIVATRVNQEITDRMGMIRAGGTTNPISYGCYCAFMALVILYKFENTKKIKYMIFLLIDMLAFVCTMSRSSLLCFAIVIFAQLIIRNIKFIRPYLIYVPFVVVGIIVIFMASPGLRDSVSEMFKSVLNSLGIGRYELSSEFGLNADNAAYSRMVQWSAIEHMEMDGELLFGYGYNAISRGEVYYYFKQFGTWTRTSSVDVGFVRAATDYGLCGLILNIGLVLGVIFNSFIRKSREQKYDFYNLAIYAMMLYIVLNIASAFYATTVFWLFMSLFFVYRKVRCSEETA
ncbi:MAG: oligosaccharide repeat unit polymerase [Lachnospiraceae bacterium]|nr:oligosaccharide repeat unit polymerase [Lachnospiraceae bacterium]